MSVFLKPKLNNNEIPNLTNKRVLIVGGTHGMGLELAKMCNDLGAYVVVIGKTNNKDIPESILQINCDIFRSSIVHLINKVDYCFNNIGLYYKGTIEETRTEVFKKIIDKNLIISYKITKLALKHMNKGGVLVNMASRPTLDSYHSWSAYTIAKQGIITLTKSASEEGNLKCYAICPSRVDTKFRDALFPDENIKTRLKPVDVAETILKLFNGKNPNGEAYWIKEV